MDSEPNELRKQNKRLQKELAGARQLLRTVRNHANFATNNLVDDEDLREALETIRDTIDHNTPGLIKVTVEVE